MEDQGKRLLLAVAIVFGLMMVWNKFFPPPEVADKRADEQAAVSDNKDSGDDRAGGGDKPATDTATDTAGEAQPTPTAAEEFVGLSFDKFKVEFTNYGAKLTKFELVGDRYKNDDGEQIDLVRSAAPSVPFGLAFQDSTHQVPKNAVWAAKKTSETEVIYEWSNTEFTVSKTFRMLPDEFSIEIDIEFKNLSQKIIKQKAILSTFSVQDPNDDVGGGWGSVPVEWKPACFSDGEIKERTIEDILDDGLPDWRGKAQWAGFVHSYFAAVVAADDTAERVLCDIALVDRSAGLMRADIIYPTIELSPGDPSYTWKNVAYFGPKDLELLDSLDRKIGRKTGLSEVVDLGFFAMIARPMLSLLKFFYSVVGNWGLAIILLTFTVKLLLLPWTHKSMKSSKKMAALAPKMKVLQEKFKDDKGAQQQAIMAMYKTEGVSPLSGCLPMLLQMPIWIALYRMLMLAAELYHAPFVPGWIDDLTSPDPFYVLPVVFTATSFVQSKITMTAAGPQQKMLMFGMPAMFGFMSLMFPSGLTLYMMTNMVLTVLHHVLIKKGDVKTAANKPAASAAAPKSKQTDPKQGSKSTKTSETAETTTSDEGDEGDDKSSSQDTGSSKASNQTGSKKKSRKKRRRR